MKHTTLIRISLAFICLGILSDLVHSVATYHLDDDEPLHEVLILTFGSLYDLFSWITGISASANPDAYYGPLWSSILYSTAATIFKIGFAVFLMLLPSLLNNKAATISTLVICYFAFIMHFYILIDYIVAVNKGEWELDERFIINSVTMVLSCIGFFLASIPVLKHLFPQLLSFKIKATRSEFWLIVIIQIDLIGIASLVDYLLTYDSEPGFYCAYAALLFTFYPMLATECRRLRDRNLSPWLVLLRIVPIANLWLFIQVAFLKGKSADGTPITEHANTTATTPAT